MHRLRGIHPWAMGVFNCLITYLVISTRKGKRLMINSISTSRGQYIVNTGATIVRHTPYSIVTTTNKPAVSVRSSTYTVVSCPTTNAKGDRRKPNAFWYTVDRGQALNGTLLKEVRSSNATSTEYYWQKEEGVSTVSVGFSGISANSSSAQNKALSKLADTTRGSLDLSIDVAEWKQSQKMIRDCVKLEQYTRDFSHKTIASQWLQYSFGVKPLIQSLYDSVAEVQRAAPALRRVQSRSSDVVKTSKTEIDAYEGWKTLKVDRCSARVEYGFIFRDSPSMINTLAKFSSLNPVSILWETTRLSFLVDYVIDIGGYMRNFETAMLYSGAITDGYKTVTIRKDSTWTRTGSGVPALNANWMVSGSLTGFASQVSMSRTLLSSYPFPVKPVFDVQLGSTRLLNVAALLAGLLPRKERNQALMRISNARNHAEVTALKRTRKSSRRRDSRDKRGQSWPTFLKPTDWV